EVRQHRDDGQVERARQGDPGQHEVQVVSGRLTGPDARHKSTILLHVVRHVVWVERDGDVEVREEDDQQEVGDDVDGAGGEGDVVRHPGPERAVVAGAVVGELQPE